MRRIRIFNGPNWHTRMGYVRPEIEQLNLHRILANTISCELKPHGHYKTFISVSWQLRINAEGRRPIPNPGENRDLPFLFWRPNLTGCHNRALDRWPLAIWLLPRMKCFINNHKKGKQHVPHHPQPLRPCC